MNKLREQEGLTALGRKTEYRQDYAPEVLETFLNKHPDNDYWVRFNCPEFTSLCPITGQPDFAEIRISYIPAERMVESKSLKLYLFSFRNHGDFHEDCVNIIMKDLIRLMQPKYIEVTGIFTPRGGISIWPYANYGMPGTQYEKLAILATHTADVSFPSFAAEVQYHARFLTPLARIPIPFLGRSLYDSAIRADMTIDDCELEGPAPFHNLNSRWVRRQAQCHPEYANL